MFLDYQTSFNVGNPYRRIDGKTVRETCFFVVDVENTRKNFKKTATEC